MNAQNVGQIVGEKDVTNAHAGTRVRIPPAPDGAVGAGKVMQLAKVLGRASEPLGLPCRGGELAPR